MSSDDTDRALEDAVRVLVANGKYRDAIDRLQFARREAEKNYGSWHPSALEHRIRLAETLTQAGRLIEAEQEMRKLLNELVRRNEGESIYAARARTRLADVLFRSERTREAVGIAEAAYDLLRRRLTETNPETLEARTILGITQDRDGQYKEATATLTALLEYHDQGHRDSIDVLPVLWALSHVAVVSKQFERAVELGARAVEESSRLYGPRHKATAKAWTVMAVNAQELNLLRDALTYAETAIAIFQENDALHMPSAEIAVELATTLRALLGRVS